MEQRPYDQPQPFTIQQPASPEPQPTSPAKSPPLQGPTSTYAEATRINVADLLHLVPQLVTRIDHLEKELKEHKQTTAAVIVKLVKRVKKLETRERNLGEEDVFETPKGKDSGETDISPSGLQAIETLVQVASQKTKTYTGEVSKEKKGCREEQPQPKRSKRQIREEEASLADDLHDSSYLRQLMERKVKFNRLDAFVQKIER
ncbi:hypothetical protein Tco_1053907 [Tanacetum coccineum]|uniref:Uncharacterized protein n=1 Tax=Tanacetum coccineum TaxID=301880 RepID=A0ABQ5GVA3_9ASTR